MIMARTLLMAVAAGLSGCATPVLNHRYPPIGEIVEVEGQRLHLVDAGPDDTPEGPPLILVHGANSNLRDFESSIAPLLRRHHRVMTVDRPGFGHSPRHRGEWQDPARLADLILTAAEERGIEQAVLLGHSWAGSITMAALVEHSERIRGGISLSGAAGHWAGGPDWDHALAGWPLIGPLFAHTVLWPAGSVVLDSAVAGVLEPNPVPDNYSENIAASLALRGGTFLANGRDMRELSEWLQNFSPRYREIRQPLLFLHGAADELVPWWNHGQRVLPVVPHAQAQLLDGVGHSPHHAIPEELAKRISAWARSLPE